MLDKLDFKQKNILLLIIILILSIAGYKRCYKPLFNNITQFFQAKNIENELQKNKNELFHLLAKSNQLNILVGDFISNEKTQQEILNIVTRFDNINISKINESHIFKSHMFNTYSNIIVLEGNYNQLTTALLNIEKNIKLSKIINSSFQLKKNYSKKDQLFLHILFQNYEKNNN